MDTFRVSFLSYVPAASSRRGLPWLWFLLALASGCANGRPARVQIQASRTGLAWEAESPVPASLKVTTFNVWGLPRWINGASSDRYGRIAHELARQGSDVVLLQEVWTRRSFEVLSEQAKGNARNWWTASVRRKGTFLGQNGLLTLSRFPIEGGEFRRFSTARLPDSLMRKGALKVTLALRPGLRVNVWNVHLQDGTSGPVRSRQIAELVEWIGEAQDGQLADIVGGDFNFTPESGEFQQFAAAVGPSVHQLARTAAPPTWDGLKTSPDAGQTLDHIFVRLRQPVEEVRGWTQRLFTAARPEDRLSDHMGVEACLTFSGAEETRPAILVLRTAAPALAETAALTRR